MTAPTDTTRAHLAAIISLLSPLTDGSDGDYQLYQGTVDVADEDLTFPYLVVRTRPGARDLINLAATLSSLSTLVQILAVGQDQDEALAALDRAAEHLHGKRPTIAGRDCSIITQQPGAADPIPDDSVHGPDGQPVWLATTYFELHSTPRST